MLTGGAMDGMEVKVDPRESTWTARAIYQHQANPHGPKPPAAISYARTDTVDEFGRSIFVPVREPGADS